MALPQPVKAIDLAYTEKLFSINVNSPLLLALNMFSSSRGIFRLAVVDSHGHVKGVLSGLRILETLAGQRGKGMHKRAGRGFEPLLRQPVRFFISEYLHKLSYTLPLKGLLSYISENNVCHILLVDNMNVLKGVVTERCILSKITRQQFNLQVQDIMTPKVHILAPSNTILDAITMMSSYKIRRLPILEEGSVRGVITATDLLVHLVSSEHHIEAVLTKENINQFLLESIQQLPLSTPQTVSLEDDIGQLIRLLKQNRSTGFPVVNGEGELKGIVSSRDMCIKVPKMLELDRFVEIIQE